MMTFAAPLSQARPVHRWLAVLITIASFITPAHAAGKKYALIVGVKEYRPIQLLPELSYTENDANALADVLKAVVMT